MAAPGELSVAVTAGAACRWTATAGAPWITVIDGATGETTGTVRFTILDNWDAPRSSVVKIRHARAGLAADVRVDQAGCRYGTSRSVIVFDRAGGTGSFDVVQQADPLTCGGPLQNACLWTAVADAAWISITSPLPRKGDQPVAFTVAPNTNGADRTAAIAVRDQRVQIVQSRN